MKMAMALTMVILLAGASMYLMKLRSDTAALNTNQIKLKETVIVQKEPTAKQEKESKKVLAANQKAKEFTADLKK